MESETRNLVHRPHIPELDPAHLDLVQYSIIALHHLDQPDPLLRARPALLKERLTIIRRQNQYRLLAPVLLCRCDAFVPGFA